ncbi:tetratricopeptide repeat protein [Amycolatopsis sp. VC5-11]|uniref:tetratricopeptide repeat protein n=1 Tax=Amycolatopsis sp. VC5-11 TaxID=3120156 RepID=UPI00300B7364
MEWERVAAVTGAGGPGSGYVVGPRLVLTSAHVVAEVGTSVTVFRPGREGSFTGTVAWCGTPGGRDDAALVVVDDSAWTSVEDGGVVRWGRTVTHRPGIGCECWGVPDLVQRPGRAVEVEQLAGTLNPGDGLVGGRYVMKLAGHPPGGGSPWGGMSGAAMFCDGLLTGVIAADPAGRGHAALEAVPASVLLADQGFAAVVNACTGTAVARCEPVELQALAERGVPAGGGVSSPAGLLSARKGIVPFRGRDTLLAELTSWADTPGTGVWLLHGPGGQGKTRLAYHFGEQLAGRSWAVVWLDRAAGPVELRVLGDARVPVLAVLDYAESRTEQLTGLAEVLESRSQVKVLLLARTAGAWWQDLPADGDAARDLADLARVSELSALGDSAGTYQAAVAAFAAAATRIPGLDPASWTAAVAHLADHAPEEPDESRTVLAVQMTALADLLDATHASAHTAPAERGPEDRLLDHERGYWRSTARAHGLLPGMSLATLGDVVAAVSLLGPDTPRDLDQVLDWLPALDGQPRDRRDAVRAWLTQLYPAAPGAGFVGLAPDRLAERLIGRLLQDRTRPCVVDALAGHVDYGQASRMLTVCVRAAAHTAFGTSVGDAVTNLCLTWPEKLLEPAIDTATRVEAPAPLLRALEHAAKDPAIALRDLQRMSDAFPHSSHALADTAATVAQALLARHREATAQGRPTDESILARHLNKVSNRLGDVGRREEALAAVTEAVETCRRLASQRPDAYLPDLAGSLSNLSNGLGDVGRREESLAAVTEAVEIHRRLADERPAAYLPDLAMSLSNLSIRLGDVGRREESLAAVTEAVEIHRRLADERPAAYLPDLARSLSNLSIRLSVLGRREEGLAAVTESVETYRQLASQRPDAYLPDLAGSLSNLSNRLGDVGRREEALAPVTEAVEIHRRLADERPAAYLPDLAMSLNNLSIRLSVLGRREEALAPVTEAVEIHRRLADERPAAYLPDLARSLSNLSIRLGDVGRREEGLAAVTESVETYRQLASQRPDAYLPDLAMSLNNLSIRLGDVGRREESLALVTEAVEIRRRLADERPDAYLPDLAMSLSNLSIRLSVLGRWEEALAPITEAVEIRRQLASQRPAAHEDELQQSLRVLALLQRAADQMPASTQETSTPPAG